MRSEATSAEISFYRENGFLVVDPFLSAAELAEWRAAIGEALQARGRFLMPEERWEEDRQNRQYYSAVLTQRLNLWQTSDRVRKLVVNRDLGRFVAQVSGMRAVRLAHDQALIKQPFSPPTGFHLDAPFWPFESGDSLTMWVALDDATFENGAMCYLPGVHKERKPAQVSLEQEIGGLFRDCPEWAQIMPQFCVVKAGGCVLHNGFAPHGACANMTPRPRRAMTVAFYPDGALFNGNQNILSDEQMSRLKPGDPYGTDDMNPILYAA